MSLFSLFPVSLFGWPVFSFFYKGDHLLAKAIFSRNLFLREVARIYVSQNGTVPIISGFHFDFSVFENLHGFISQVGFNDKVWPSKSDDSFIYVQAIKVELKHWLFSEGARISSINYSTSESSYNRFKNAYVSIGDNNSNKMVVSYLMENNRALSVDEGRQIGGECLVTKAIHGGASCH